MKVGSGCEVRVERWSLSRAQGTWDAEQNLRTLLEKVEPHVSSGSKPSAHIPLSYLTSLKKNKLKDKIIKNFKTVIKEL